MQNVKDTQKTTNIHFDPDGDVVLVVESPTSSETARFLVSSKILCLSSSVFRAMLNLQSGFREGKALAQSSCPLEIPLTDDNPDALAVILRIIHMHIKGVPDTFPPSLFYQIVILCDKYDMWNPMEYWLKKWTPLNLALFPVSTDKCLFLAFVLGKEKEFNSFSRDLILNCETDSDGDLNVVGNPESDIPLERMGFDMYVPDSIVAEIRRVRQEAIDSILDLIRNTIERYANLAEIKCELGSEICDASNLGILIRAFKSFINLGVLTTTTSNTTISSQSLHLSLLDLKKLLLRIQPPEYLAVETPRGCCSSPMEMTECSVMNSPKDSKCGACFLCFMCKSCKSIYSPSSTSENHATKCSPLVDIQKHVKEIMEGIKGLEYREFVRTVREKGGGVLSPFEMGCNWT